MIVIDTPGLLSAPTKLRHMNEQQRQLQQAAKEAEHLVLEKMKCQDYLILCVEVRPGRRFVPLRPEIAVGCPAHF
jgi:hypothetical protein